MQELRRRRVGYVPERPIHGTRNQGAARLPGRILRRAAALPGEIAGRAGRRRRAPRAAHYRGESSGPDPTYPVAAGLLRLQDLDVHVYDRAGPGPKSALVEAMGAHYIWAEKRRLGHKLANE